MVVSNGGGVSRVKAWLEEKRKIQINGLPLTVSNVRSLPGPFFGELGFQVLGLDGIFLVD